MSDKSSSKHNQPSERIPDETREHLRAARAEMRKSWETLLPPGFVEHRRAARREMLLAVRTLVDAALQRIETRDDS